jgi:hypothetical protein
MREPHWRRERPAFYNLLALEREHAEAPGGLRGTPAALLSRDAAATSQSWVVELPPGWRTEHDGGGGALELVVLRGTIEIEGRRLGGGSYLDLPRGFRGGELRSPTGALAIAFWELSRSAEGGAGARAERIADIPWQMTDPSGHGVMHKSLRLPDPAGGDCDGGRHGFVRLMAMASGVDAPYQHAHHECFEELICLGGDLLLVDEGSLALGTVAAHPREWWHGPFASRSGALVLVHTDAAMGPWPVRDYPAGDEICDAYLDESPWDSPPEHTVWESTSWSARQDSHEHRAWRGSPDGRAYFERPSAHPQPAGK